MSDQDTVAILKVKDGIYPGISRAEFNKLGYWKKYRTQVANDKYLGIGISNDIVSRLVKIRSAKGEDPKVVAAELKAEQIKAKKESEEFANGVIEIAYQAMIRLEFLSAVLKRMNYTTHPVYNWDYKSSVEE